MGPRPALPSEAAQFPPELRRREEMPQGLTGLWQLDGRTDADFGKYTELDLRYVDEWSLGLDLDLVLRTPGRRAASCLGVPVPSASRAPSGRAVLELGDGAGDVTIDLPRALRTRPMSPSTCATLRST